MKSKKQARKDLSKLQLETPKHGVFQVVIETPKGSRNKYAFDREQRTIILRKVLPAGMVFPYDFGFLPRTTGADGDPLDVLLLMDEPAVPGVVVHSRLIGIIEGEQTEDGKTIRNDRLLAVAEVNHSYANIHRPSDLPKHFLRELEEFFVNYHRLDGHHYKLLGCRGLQEAEQQIEKARKAA